MLHSVFKNTGEKFTVSKEFSDAVALPLERDRLLDLLCSHVRPILLKHFHVSIRITSGTVLVDPFRTQTRPVNAWFATEPIWIGVEKGPFFHRHGYALRTLAN